MRPIRELTARARGAWESAARRYRLRELPAMPAICAALLLGLAVPLIAGVDSHPPELSLSLARARLAAYARSDAAAGAEPRLGPTGPIFSPRPAFYWPACAGADHYELTIQRSDGSAWFPGGRPEAVHARFYLPPPPSALDTGRSYRFEVRAVDAQGDGVRWKTDGRTHVALTGSFSVVEPPDELRELRARARRHWDEFDADFVLLGYYAQFNSHHDVITSLLALYRLDAASFERRLIGDTAPDAPRDWLARRIAQVLRLVRN